MDVSEYPDDPDPERTNRLRGYGTVADWGAGRFLWKLLIGGAILGIIRWLAG